MGRGPIMEVERAVPAVDQQQEEAKPSLAREDMRRRILILKKTATQMGSAASALKRFKELKEDDRSPGGRRSSDGPAASPRSPQSPRAFDGHAAAERELSVERISARKKTLASSFFPTVSRRRSISGEGGSSPREQNGGTPPNMLQTLRAYYKPNDDSVQSDKDVLLRELIRMNPAIQNVLNAIYELADEDGNNVISKSEYIECHLAVYEAFHDVAPDNLAFQVAEGDFHVDCMGEPTIDRARFIQCWFQVAGKLLSSLAAALMPSS